MAIFPHLAEFFVFMGTKTLLYVYKSMEGLSSLYIQDYSTVKMCAEGAMRRHSSSSTNFGAIFGRNVLEIELYQWLPHCQNLISEEHNHSGAPRPTPNCIWG